MADGFNIKPYYLPDKKEVNKKAPKELSEEEQRIKKIEKLFFDTPTWTTKKIDIYDKLVETGEAISLELPSPYLYNEMGVLKPNLNVKLTEQELEEYEKCKLDPVYFAENYCQAMTDKGISNFKLRPYQKKVLKDYLDHRFNVFLSARQSGKSITSAFFILWFMTFEKDRNSLIVADKGATMMELIDKIKTSYLHLPTFLKIGVKRFAGTKLVFENGCRLLGQATSTKPGLGQTIHLLYIDEFAHIHPNIIDVFFRTVFPTVSSSDISRVIITSTANGKNKFYDIYTKATRGENSFNAIRVDYWEIPGRDEEWKKCEISNLGSIQAFNQEYGNQFITSERMFFDEHISRLSYRIKSQFNWEHLEPLFSLDSCPVELTWDKNLKFDTLKERHYILSIDLADGVGLDYSVLNIFRIEGISRSNARKLKTSTQLSDFLRLRQVGILRSKFIGLQQFNEIVYNIIYYLFNFDKIRIVLETNDQRAFGFIKMMEKHPEYEETVFLKTKHSHNANIKKIGVRLNSVNKTMYFSELRKKIQQKNIIITEENSYQEFSNLALDDKGHYSVQLGNDDIIMTFLHASRVLFEEDMQDFLMDAYNDLPDNFKGLIDDLLDKNFDNIQSDGIDYKNILSGLNL